MRNRFVRPLYSGADDGGGGVPPQPSLPAVPPAPAPVAPPVPDPAAAGGQTIEQAQIENREKARKIAALQKTIDDRAEADRQAEEQAAIDRGEHETVIQTQADKLAAANAKLAGYETAETEEKTAASIEFETALEGRSDAEAIRQRCVTWGGPDPRKQLKYFRDEVLPATLAPAPLATTPPVHGGNPEAPLPELTAAEKKVCDENGIEHEFYAKGKAKSQENPALKRTIEDLGGR